MTTAQEQALLSRLLSDRIWHLRNYIREQDNLSVPCPPGRWRWADNTIDGYHRKSEEQLAADREKAAKRAAAYRAELAVAEAARDNLTALACELDSALRALSGDSNDAEHEALYGLAETVAGIIGVPLDLP